MRRRGFTVIELAICLTLMTILVPLVYGLMRNFENEIYRAAAEAESAQAMRAVSEEVRRDLQALELREGGAGMELVGACGSVQYAVEGDVLFRRASAACGGDRPVARRVQGLTREPRALVVTFGRPMRPELPAVSSFRLAW